MSDQPTNSQKLRQKAISLLYLLFIALVFIYVPADFLDSINETNRSFEKTSAELSSLKNKKFIMFEKSGYGLNISNITDSFKYRKISQISDSAYNHIQRVKSFLVEETGGYNQYGYPAKSKEFDITDHLMLNSSRASDLKKAIERYKTELLPYLSDGQESILDSVLIIKEQHLSSKGKLISWEEFYFKKAPLSVTQMMLSKFQSEIRLVEYLVLDKYERDFLADIFIRSGLAKPASEESSLGERKLILSNNKIVYAVGENVVIESEVEGIPSDSLNTNTLSAKVRIGESESDATVSDKGAISFKPETAGRYEVVASYKDQSPVTLGFDVISPTPVINKQRPEALFMGIRNPLKIEFEYEGLEDLEISSTQGVVSKIGDLYYFKTDVTGEVTISAEATIKGKKVHVAKRKFKVTEPPIPYVTLNSLRGGEVLDINMKTQRKLYIKSDFYDSDNYFNIKQFRMTRLSGDGSEINKLSTPNRTGNFGAKAKEMLSKAKKGDMYVINEILVVSADGKESEVQSLVFKVI